MEVAFALRTGRPARIGTIASRAYSLKAAIIMVDAIAPI